MIILISGGNPLEAYRGLIEGAFGSPKAISETLIWSTPYIFAGLAVALAFKGGLFNIGAEGQLALGALAAAWLGYGLAQSAGHDDPGDHSRADLRHRRRSWPAACGAPSPAGSRPASARTK